MYLLLLISITTLLTFYVYTKLQVPKNLRHIPSNHAFKWLKEIFSNKHYDVKVREMVEGEYSESKVQLSWVMGKYLIRFNSLEAAKTIYNDTKTFPKLIPSARNPDRLFSKFLGESVVFSSHGVWKKHRKVVNPPFKKQFETKTFVDTTRQFFTILDSNESNRKLDGVHRYMQRITMDCLGKDIMGVEFNSIINPDVEFLTCYNAVMSSSMQPLYFLVPFLDTESNPWRKPAFEQLHKMNNYFKNILSEKRKILDNEDIDESKLDLLTLLIKAGKDETNEFSDLDIQNNITTFLLAGHDTTAFALTAALHLLAEHPDIQEKARKEVMKVMEYKYEDSNPSQARAPTLEQTKNMPYLMAVIKETMRLYPSVARLPERYAAEDVEIDGYFIPKGTGVMLDTYCLHRDPNHFKNPNDFVPERFINENDTVSKDPVAWAPFGGGSRLCLGINFSLLEQKVVLAMILARYQLKNSSLEFKFSPLLMPEQSTLEFIPLNEVV